MGAKSSTEFGQIHITTDKPSYFQAESAHGTISLNLVKNFPGNEIFLKIKGTEVTRWSEGSGKNRRYYHGKRIIISHQFPLYKFNTAFISPGQYNFPFSIYLSPALPASFYHAGIFAQISYKIKGEIKSTDKKYKHLRSSKILHMKQMKNDAYAPPIAHLKVAVDICCCFAQGLTNIETKVNKTNFFQGEVAYVDCSIDNSQCDLPLKSVTMRLIRKLVVKSNGGHTHISNYILVIRSTQLNIPAKSPNQVQTRFEIPIKSTAKIPSTCIGHLIKNIYVLSLLPYYESFLCNCRIKSVQTPILIYDPTHQDIQKIQAPPNWNPQVMPMQNCDWRFGQMYQGNKTAGYSYPQFDEGMIQQYLPPNNPAPFGYNQQNNNNNNNPGMNMNSQGMDPALFDYNQQNNNNNNNPMMNMNNQGIYFQTFQGNSEQR